MKTYIYIYIYVCVCVCLLVFVFFCFFLVKLVSFWFFALFSLFFAFFRFFFSFFSFFCFPYVFCSLLASIFSFCFFEGWGMVFDIYANLDKVDEQKFGHPVFPTLRNSRQLQGSGRAEIGHSHVFPILYSIFGEFDSSQPLGQVSEQKFGSCS